MRVSELPGKLPSTTERVRNCTVDKVRTDTRRKNAERVRVVYVSASLIYYMCVSYLQSFTCLYHRKVICHFTQVASMHAVACPAGGKDFCLVYVTASLQLSVSWTQLRKWAYFLCKGLLTTTGLGHKTGAAI